MSDCPCSRCQDVARGDCGHKELLRAFEVFLLMVQEQGPLTGDRYRAWKAIEEARTR